MKIYPYTKFCFSTVGFALVLFAMAFVHSSFKKQETNPKAAPLAKPNIIIFISDDHGYEDAGVKRLD